MNTRKGVPRSLRFLQGVGVHHHRTLRGNPLPSCMPQGLKGYYGSSFRGYGRGEMGPLRLNDATVLKMRIRTPAA
jgi:hypothetical protein